MQIRSAALTDIGKIRRDNEDRFVCDNMLQLYGVADGIGGLPGGAEAAQTAVTTLRDEVAALPGGGPPNLVRLTHRVNRVVRALAEQISPLGMGTTLTYAIVRNRHLCLAHVGDSRCYRLRGGKLTVLTADHTVENDILLRHEADELEMLDEMQRKSLTRCIGQQPAPEVDTLRMPLQPGDRYLFCTDGIDKAVGEPELAAMLGGGREPQHILGSLIAFANDAGGKDNATGVLLFVE
ncbi:MAG: protein phosphatase 2C domain-containing protein [Opitutaceae bacterium]|jgi:protein phosphatase|nr:protein phosphatase 2C domain-containing protein [Opitutaceae bacterium]